MFFHFIVDGTVTDNGLAALLVPTQSADQIVILDLTVGLPTKVRRTRCDVAISYNTNFLYSRIVGLMAEINRFNTP